MYAATFTLPSFAKINLLLRILGKRPDNFHELCTVFQAVSLKDYLTFAEHENIVLTCDDDKIPLDEKNLVIRAAKLLREKFNVKKGASIHLEKNIPSPGGLGGGSSNAAVALIGLSRLWKITINFDEITKLGSSLGSDVPFFFYGGTALGTGRGNRITQMPDIPPERLLIVTPDIAVSTATAFESVKAPDLTNNRSKSILQICCNEANSLDLPQTNFVNDFESTIFNIEPEIAAIKQKLLNFGAKQALLSGSGASVFAIFKDERSLQNAFDNLKNAYGDWRVFATRTISQTEYADSLGFKESLQSTGF
jgi:4-diphosphocytidyl-2-C-methyl-D-erythritol kinase